MSGITSAAPSVSRAVAGPLRSGTVALGGSALLALSAHIAFPFWPVPLTLQTLAVLLIGAVAGPRLGFACVLAYLAEGLAGLPVFATGAGSAVLLGPTGGYLLGYLPAVALAGLAVGRGRGSTLRTVLIFSAADALVFALGLARLVAIVGGGEAVAVGLAPFLLGESLKIALAAAVLAVGRGFFKR